MVEIIISLPGILVVIFSISLDYGLHMYGVISCVKAQMYSLVVPQICSLVNFGEVKFSI
jgi:hypothetical protein